MDTTFRKSQEMVAQYNTRDPYELLDRIGAVTKFTTAFEADHLKGFAMIENRIRYAVINDRLNEYEQRIVAGHEAAHIHRTFGHDAGTAVCHGRGAGKAGYRLPRQRFGR